MIEAGYFTVRDASAALGCPLVLLGRTRNLFEADQEHARRLADHVPKRNLPPTGADAVLLTRALQMRFLWIDALCILQDNVSHWAMQVRDMGGI
jgi:hypothetical protein